MLGRHHPTIRRIRALRRDAALRRAEGLYVAEGPRLAAEALASGARVELALTSPRLEQRADGAALLAALRERDVPHEQVADNVIDGLQDARSPQPALLLLERSEDSLERCLGRPGEVPLIVVAHRIQDPGNLGALLRTSEAAAASSLVAVGESADLFHPRVVRAAMGSSFRLPACSADEGELRRTLAGRGIARIGTRGADATRYDACDLTRPLAIHFGREGDGLPEILLTTMDDNLAIPMNAPVESLSVGAAAAVILFEAARQRSR
ncbi:MAG: RNA methyltransferase [bacterium]|nr:RNA methyltransferase [bacterium]